LAVKDKFRINARERVDIGYCYWLGHFTWLEGRHWWWLDKLILPNTF
jgi:hypothetical protein